MSGVCCRRDAVCVPDVSGVLVCCRLLCIVVVRLAAVLRVRRVAVVDVRVSAGVVKAVVDAVVEAVVEEDWPGRPTCWWGVTRCRWCIILSLGARCCGGEFRWLLGFGVYASASLWKWDDCYSIRWCFVLLACLTIGGFIIAESEAPWVLLPDFSLFHQCRLFHIRMVFCRLQLSCGFDACLCGSGVSNGVCWRNRVELGCLPLEGYVESCERLDQYSEEQQFVSAV